MKLDFSSVLRNLDGKPLKWGSEVDATLGIISAEALLANTEDQRGAPAEEKLSRWKLAQRIHGAKVIDVTAEDIVLLKRAINAAFSVAIVGPAFELLDK